jgi:hypothetical protein
MIRMGTWGKYLKPLGRRDHEATFANDRFEDYNRYGIRLDMLYARRDGIAPQQQGTNEKEPLAQ